MKKPSSILFYTLFSVFLLFVTGNTSFSDECSESCTIKKETDKVITDYRKNNRQAISNLSAALSSGSKSKSVSIPYISEIYNLVTVWPSYYIDTQFFAKNVVSEIPPAIKRDLNILESEGKSLNKFLGKLLTKNATASKVDDPCKGINNCTLHGKAGDIIKQLIHNNDAITQLYKLSLMGREGEFSTEITLVPSDFSTKLHNAYNPHTFSGCSSCKGGFKQIGEESIKMISLSNKYSEDGIQEWRDAMALIIGIKDGDAASRQKERELLQREIYRQGLSQKNGEALLDNLDRYNNNGGYGADNNPLSNTFKSFGFSIDTHGTRKLIRRFADTMAQVIGTARNALTNGNTVVPTQFQVTAVLQTSKTIEASNTIMNKINGLYTRELPFIQESDLGLTKLQGRIINMHLDLTEAIGVLEKIRPISEKVCNDQDKGAGICTFKYF